MRFERPPPHGGRVLIPRHRIRAIERAVDRVFFLVDGINEDEYGALPPFLRRRVDAIHEVLDWEKARTTQKYESPMVT